MKIGVIAFTANGAGLSKTIMAGLGTEGFTCFGFLPERYAKLFGMSAYQSLEHWSRYAFAQFGAMIFVGAVGIAVRAIAPHVDSKTRDPAVICVDELGRFAIPLLSGHIGGANRLSETIAEITGGTPVVTTATDINGVFAVDSWATANGYAVVNPENIKRVSSALLENRPVGLISDFPLTTAPPRGVSEYVNSDTGICISLDHNKAPFKFTLNIVPRCVDAGIGCRKNAPFENIETLFLKVLAEQGVSGHAVANISSIKLKASEPGLLRLSEKYRAEFVTFSSEELGGLEGEFSESEFVRGVTGVSSVCERSAVYVRGGTLVRRKTAENGVTVALAKVDWSVSFDNHGGSRP
ncbi:cobalamin biosynthesis protein CbiG [Clostridia bacterium]|nr:cobalamin biosynthesis protein CbiG [Clostridia bacterium]